MKAETLNGRSGRNLASMRIISFFVLLMLLAASSLNAADPNLDYVVPDLRAWSQVERGLPVAELEKLLGKPIKQFGPRERYTPGVVYPETYGYVAKKSDIFPEDIAFIVSIESGKVWSKKDPFGGVAISKDGTPTIPKLMTPSDASVFNHYPRIVDLRWYASSGDYPMKYEIEIDTLYPSGEWSKGRGSVEVSIPYCSYAHSGSNRGRWRVRSANVKGKSQWSDYFYFEFKV